MSTIIDELQVAVEPAALRAWAEGRANYVELVFVFSSRRRHTRFGCDWSSDVCSSDLSCGAFRNFHSGRVIIPWSAFWSPTGRSVYGTVFTCRSCRTPRCEPKYLTMRAPATVRIMMKMLMILAASRLLTAIDDSSRAMSDSVMVSREASKTMLLVAPAAWTKLVTAKSNRRGISNGSQIWKYARIHPAPDTLAAS